MMTGSDKNTCRLLIYLLILFRDDALDGFPQLIISYLTSVWNQQYILHIHSSLFSAAMNSLKIVILISLSLLGSRGGHTMGEGP